MGGRGPQTGERPTRPERLANWVWSAHWSSATVALALLVTSAIPSMLPLSRATRLGLHLSLGWTLLGISIYRCVVTMMGGGSATTPQSAPTHCSVDELCSALHHHRGRSTIVPSLPWEAGFICSVLFSPRFSMAALRSSLPLDACSGARRSECLRPGCTGERVRLTSFGSPVHLGPVWCPRHFAGVRQSSTLETDDLLHSSGSARPTRVALERTTYWVSTFPHLKSLLSARSSYYAKLPAAACRRAASAVAT